ncbi:A-kinase anchor protein 13 [Discoglossus pictus]
MKLNPQQAPLYGDCILTVLLTEETELEDDVVFYLQFAGSTLKHLISTRKVNAATLETITPGHDCCEQVVVSLCASRKGFSVVVAEENFEFVQDEAYESAQFLATNAGNQQALIFARFLDRSRPSTGDATVLDDQITLAFQHLQLPVGWNVLGSNQNITDGHLQETLMHFAARLGLCQLARFLLQQPGGRDALTVHNSEGATPLSLALERGFLKLHNLLKEVETEEESVSQTGACHIEYSGDSCVRHHCGLNVYTLTKKSQGDAPTSMDNNIEELNKYMQSHTQCQGAVLKTEPQQMLEGTPDLCFQEIDCTPVDKALSSEDVLVRDSNNSNSNEIISAKVSSMDCNTEQVEEQCTAMSNEVEAVGGEVASFSFESKNKDTASEEEEAVPVPIVKTENAAATNNDTQSSSTEVLIAEHLLSGGNPNEETGMTSTGIVSDQESLYERDNTSQEMITAKERETPNTAVAEATNKASDLTKDFSVNMGQSLSGSCTTESSTVEIQTSEQETGEVETLGNLPGNSDNTSVENCDGNSSKKCQAEEQCGIMGPVQITDSTHTGFEGKGTSDNVESGINGEKSHDKCPDVAAENKKQITEEETSILAVGCHDSDMLLKESSPDPSICEPVPANNGNCPVETEDSTATSKKCTDIPHSPLSAQQMKDLTQPVGKDLGDTDNKYTDNVPSNDIQKEKKETSVHTETSSKNCLKNQLPHENVLCCNEVGQYLQDDVVAPEGSPSTCQDTGIVELSHLVPEQQHNAVKEQSVESYIADMLQEIINNMEKNASPEPESHGLITSDENSKLPPTGQSASLQNEGDISVCAGAEWNKVTDTPSLLSNYESLQNQEVSAKGSVQSDASTEMQETAVSASCQQSGVQLQLSTCEQGKQDDELNVMFCERDSLEAKEDLSSLTLSHPCENPGADNVEIQLQMETEDRKLVTELDEKCMQHSQIISKDSVGEDSSETKESDVVDNASQINFDASEIMVENVTETTQTIISHDILGIETLCLVTSEKEEHEDVVMEPAVECDNDEEDSEVVKVSRASLHPIAEESLLNGDSSSHTTSTSSQSEGSSDLSDSEFIGVAEEEHDTTEPNLNSFSPSMDQVPDEQPVSPSPNGIVGVDNGIATVSVLSEDTSSGVVKCDSLQDKEDYVQDPGEVLSALKEEDSGLDLSANMEEALCPSMSDTEIVSAESFDGKAEDEVDFVKHLQINSKTPMINRESCCAIDPCSHPDLLGRKHTKTSTECEKFLAHDLVIDNSSQRTLKRESASDSDIFHMSSEALDEMVFAKLEEEQSVCDAASSSSSTDDTTSLERHSSHGSDISLPLALSMKKHKHKDRFSLDSSCSSTVTASVEERESEHTGTSEIEEELDSITEVPAHASRSKCSMRSLSPFRRHSWEPGKHASNDAEINRRSSMRVLGDVVRKPPVHRRSMSWCPSDVQFVMGGGFNYRSYSLEGLAGEDENKKKTSSALECSPSGSRKLIGSGEDRGSLVSLTEEEQESDQRIDRPFKHQASERSRVRGFSYSVITPSHLTKSMSLMAISQPGMETQGRIRPKRRISFSFNISPLVPKSMHVFSIGSSSSDEESDSARSSNLTSCSIAQSISEESCNHLPTSPSRKELDGKSGTKVSRTFSYIKNKMSSGKKSKEKEKDKTKEKDKEPKDKEKDKKTINGHLFSSALVMGPTTCYSCTKNFTTKDAYLCANCNSFVHKSCRESYTPCAKVKMKGLQPQDSSSLPVVMRNRGSQPKERPRSAIIAADENAISSLMISRRPQTNLYISKSISTQNIAGICGDESLAGTWKVLSQSTDSLNKISKVHESMESLVDEGTDMNEGQLMGEFEMDSRQLEAESWSQAVDSKFLRQHKKDVVKRQDVLYELMQTEMHHVRTLKIMSDVYSRGMMTELQFEQSIVDRIFPCLDDLLNIHSQFFQRILERKKESTVEKSEKNFVIKRIGDVLVNQFSGENADRMKKTYGKFCGHHNEAVNFFKDLHAKEKRFQAFTKKKMSSSVVRRLGIPECILLVTQRITKYPVLLQRILQYTKENEVEHQDLTHSLNLVKDFITAVNNKVNNYEKKMRLSDIYNKTDSKSIQRMKSGQMFAKEDLKRRKLIRDGSVSLKPTTGRLKEVLAVLLSDSLVFLQEKDQKYVFASLDQRSTVISLKKLIVREVAHEEKGLFLISMIADTPEMVEVHVKSKEERNSWIQSIQDTMNTMDKDEDEGVPSESEEERRNLDTKARELKAQLHEKDRQIIELLEEKVKIFQTLTNCYGPEDNPSVMNRILFRANTEEAPKGEKVMSSVIKEVETLQSLVSKNLWSNVGQHVPSPTEVEAGVGPISLPRRAETFGGFDSHQLNASKSGEKDEGEDAQDLRRTESDSVLKKKLNANMMIKRNSEQVLQSVDNLHKLLSVLQAVVLEQDTYIEDQKLHLNERALTRTSSRPNSLIEQEKQRSLEKQRQELANLQKQQAHHLDEKRKREREWEAREKELTEREERIVQREELASKGLHELEQERSELQARKEEYQHDLERLRAAQKQLEKEREQMKQMEKVSCQHDKLGRIPSLPIGADSSKWYSSSSSKQEHLEAELSASPKKDSLIRTESKQKGKGHFHLLGTNQTNKSVEAPTPNRLFNLTKTKEKKEKKKKSKGSRSQMTESGEGATHEEEIFC